MEKLITKSFKRLLDKGIHRGFITYEELGKSLGKRHYSQDNIETAFLHIFDNKVCLVEKKADYHSIKKKDSASIDSEKNVDLDKTDDPIRMYLREMGGVDLLSREGEIAIAKRIEAGKNVMISALLQSPLTARRVCEWKKQIEKNEFSVILLSHVHEVLFQRKRVSVIYYHKYIKCYFGKIEFRLFYYRKYIKCYLEEIEFWLFYYRKNIVFL